MGDMISRHRPDSTITYVSPSCHDLLGYTPDELLNTRGDGHVHPDDRHVTWDTINAAASQQARCFRVEYRARRKDGRYVWVESAGSLIYGKEGELSEIQSIARDVTERKRVSGALQTSEERFRAVFHQTFQLMGLFDLNGTLLAANKTALEMIDAQEEDVVGESEGEGRGATFCFTIPPKPIQKERR